MGSCLGRHVSMIVTRHATQILAATRSELAGVGNSFGRGGRAALVYGCSPEGGCGELGDKAFTRSPEGEEQSFSLPI